jgi:hypothetical protein
MEGLPRWQDMARSGHNSRGLDFGITGPKAVNAAVHIFRAD